MKSNPLPRRRVYAVDTLIDTVRAISKTEPVYFQRDGSFYAATPDGFGKLGYGLCLRPQNPEKATWRQELPEIVASENILVKLADENELTKFRRGERTRTRPLLFNKDSCSFMSLESMATTVALLKKLPDDGKIRMIGHSTSYHSHKFGYAADGSDVWLGVARVMKRKTYLEMMRTKEDELIESLTQNGLRAAERIYEDKTYTFANGRSVEIPDVWVITPNIMLTFPREGRLDYHDRDQSWRADSDLNRRNLPEYFGIKMYDESPFTYSLVINRKVINGRTRQDFGRQTTKSLNRLGDELAGVATTLPRIQLFLKSINTLHDQICHEKIEWRKSLSKRKD